MLSHGEHFKLYGDWLVQKEHSCWQSNHGTLGKEVESRVVRIGEAKKPEWVSRSHEMLLVMSNGMPRSRENIPLISQEVRENKEQTKARPSCHKYWNSCLEPLLLQNAGGIASWWWLFYCTFLCALVRNVISCPSYFIT